MSFLLTAIFIGYIGAASNASPSQPQALIQATASSQATESHEQNAAEVVARLTVDESGTEVRIVYDRSQEKCILQWAEKGSDDKETTRTIFTEDDCGYPYVYSFHAYIASWDYPQLVMLRRGLGDPCPAMYRIIQLPRIENDFVVTKSFGNCSPNTALFFDGHKLIIKIKSHYMHPDRHTKPETWVYSNKRLRQIKTTKRRR